MVMIHLPVARATSRAHHERTITDLTSAMIDLGENPIPTKPSATLHKASFVKMADWKLLGFKHWFVAVMALSYCIWPVIFARIFFMLIHATIASASVNVSG
jgi:hypothetical protein